MTQSFLRILSVVFIAVVLVVAPPAYAGGKGGGKGDGADGKQFVELSPLMLPVIGQRGSVQTISLVVALEVPDGAAAEKVNFYSPKLTDAMIQGLYGELGEGRYVRNGVVNIVAVKERMAEIADYVLGHDVFSELLIQVVHQRG